VLEVIGREWTLVVPLKAFSDKRFSVEVREHYPHSYPHAVLMDYATNLLR
jgi:hypothetical protein